MISHLMNQMLSSFNPLSIAMVQINVAINVWLSMTELSPVCDTPSKVPVIWR